MQSAEEAYREAERRIAAWREGEELDLAIEGLEEVPEAIGRLTELAAVRFTFWNDGNTATKGAKYLRSLIPLAGLTNLQSLDCFDTQVADLAPLKTLTNLHSLDCSGTQVADLGPLKSLKNLQSLNCIDTQIADLAPLKGLEAEYRSNADVAQACEKLAAELKAIPPGNQHASAYHDVIFRALCTLFHPELVVPRKEAPKNKGKKLVDIVFANAANSGFFSAMRSHLDFKANFILAECKNYSKDVKNPEIDQLLGRFDENVGKLGLLACRSVADNKALIDSCRYIVEKQRKCIVVLTDSDVENMLRAKAADDGQTIQAILFGKFWEIVS